MKEKFAYILAGIVALAVVTGLLFYFGVIGNVYDSTITKQHMDIERNNFKESKSYVEGMIQDLAKYKRQYDQTNDLSEKKAVLNFVDNEFANFDASKIEDPALNNFLLQARGQ